LDKNRLGQHFGRFFANASGPPAQQSSKNIDSILAQKMSDRIKWTGTGLTGFTCPESLSIDFKGETAAAALTTVGSRGCQTACEFKNPKSQFG
jgi:hypothetical protein